MSQSMRRAMAFGFVTLAIGAIGCSGSRSHVVAPSAQYPVSMSDGVRNTDGKLLPDEHKKLVGGFSYDYKAWGMLWRIFSFTGDRDISEEVNDQIKRANGDAIVNLSVKAESCTWNIFTLIGIFPDCSTVRVRGHIIKAEPLASTPKQPSAPAAVEAPVSSIDVAKDAADLALAR